MRNLLTAAAIFLSAAAGSWAQSKIVEVDLQREDEQVDLDTSQASQKGWTFKIQDAGEPWTAASLEGYTGHLYYADAWTGATFTVEIDSVSVTSNEVVFAPTRAQVATSGVFACEFVMENGTDYFTASRGELEILPSISGNTITMIALFEYPYPPTNLASVTTTEGDGSWLSYIQPQSTTGILSVANFDQTAGVAVYGESAADLPGEVYIWSARGVSMIMDSVPVVRWNADRNLDFQGTSSTNATLVQATDALGVGTNRITFSDGQLLVNGNPI